MTNIILHILCEGQTEVRFVKEVLAPYLSAYSIYPKPILLLTSKKKNAHGGMLSFQQAARDMEILLRSNRDKGHDKHLFTTMFDYYALPNDFPGFSLASKMENHKEGVELLEESFGKEFNHTRIIPYIQLHEFEALLFTDIMKLCIDYPLAEDKIELLKEETDAFDNPEEINNSPETAPSKRIIKAVQNHYNYNKVKSGPDITKIIGINELLNNCPHFSDWINKLAAVSKRLQD